MALETIESRDNIVALHDRPARIVFWHLMKTAGTSVYRNLRDAVKESADWSESLGDAKAFPVYGGHYDLEAVLGEPARLITFLRDPLERIVSLFNYTKTLTNKELIHSGDLSAYKISTLDFEQLTASEDHDVLRYSSNYYCKSLLGDDFETNLSENDILPAINALLNDFAFIGFVDDFAADVDAMMACLGLPQPLQFHHEKAIGSLMPEEEQIRLEKLRPDQVRMIAAQNQWDLKFYRHARQRFQAKVKRMPIRFDVAALPTLGPGHMIACNRTAVPFANMFAFGWHDLEEGIWSAGTVSTLAFFCRPRTSALVLHLDVPHWTNRLSARLEVKVNGRRKPTVYLVFSRRPVDLGATGDYLVVAAEHGATVQIPVTVNGDIDAQHGGCEIELTIDEPFVPSQRIDSGDIRELGFKLQQIDVV